VIPAEVQRAVRMASVAPHVAAMFAHLPQPVRVDADLPDDPQRIPTVALQLLKLPLLVDRVRIGRIAAAGVTRVVVSLNERSCVLEGSALELPLRAAARLVLSSLFEGSDVARVLSDFAFQSSNLTTLQRITHHMLQATDLDRALYVMLSGITAGYGLAFNRAAIFVRDEERGVFRGDKAIGPADEGEAHRIWEAIELEEKSLDQMITDSAERRLDTRFQEVVQGIELAPGDDVHDEVATALAAPRSVVFEGRPRSEGLARLGPTSGFVLAAIRSHGRVRGLLFADNRWSGAPVAPEQLSHIGFYTDQTALVWENLSLLARVEAAAREDALTGVWNRRELDARFEAERSRCQRSGTPCSVMVLDVDRFKATNDEHGHAAGDDVLRKIGTILKRHVREHDIAARLGGDEFVIVLPDATNEHLVAVAARIGALAAEEGVSISIGGATWPDDTPDLDALLAAADANLYEAKRAGRGCAFVAGARVAY